MNVGAAKAGWSEEKDRGSESESLSSKDRRTRRLQISYLNESFRKEEERERERYPFVFSGVFCFLFLESCLIRVFIILCGLCSNVI